MARLYSIYSKGVPPGSKTKRKVWVRLSPSAMPVERARSYYGPLLDRHNIELRPAKGSDMAGKDQYDMALRSFLEGKLNG
jgi:hypothetical protein